jgi:uncharacterized membrane protein YhaH (DUF805 family)
MSFGQAVGAAFRQYATFSGRARRSEFWYWFLFVVLVGIVTANLDDVLNLDFVAGGYYGWISMIVSLALVIPGLAVLFRRLHDTDRSGWWWVLSLFCGIGALVLLVFCFLEGTPGPNRYGDAPK